jgi:hypothetical protein
MSENNPDEAPGAARPMPSQDGRRASGARSDRQAAALRENLLKRKRQKRARSRPQTPLPTES